jgi:hypothetical protein
VLAQAVVELVQAFPHCLDFFFAHGSILRMDIARAKTKLCNPALAEGGAEGTSSGEFRVNAGSSGYPAETAGVGHCSFE